MKGLRSLRRCALVSAAFLAVSCAGSSSVLRGGQASSYAPSASFEAPGSVSPEWSPIAVGVGYFAFAVERPRLEAYAVRVDLTAPGVSVVVTRGTDAPPATLSRKTAGFLAENDCVAAVNANPFDPSSSIEGEIRRLVGLSISGGRLVSPPDSRYAAVLFGRDGRASIIRQIDFDPSAVPENAVGGFFIVLEDGRATGNADRRFPRTAAGVSGDGSALYLLVVDGRRLRSVGATETETGLILGSLGASDGLILDGGGSSTLALRGNSGSALVVNTPVHGGRRGAERAVGNSLGIRAPR